VLPPAFWSIAVPDFSTCARGTTPRRWWITAPRPAVFYAPREPPSERTFGCGGTPWDCSPGAFLLSGLVVDLQQLPVHQARRYDYASPSRERDRRPPPVPPPVRGPSASRSRLPVVAWTGAGGRPAPSDAGGARSGAGARSIQGDPVPVPAWWFLAVRVPRGLSFLGRGEIRFRAPYCPVWERVSGFLR
jgi:hypothetical protein